jgi:hypothetical protein
MKLDFSEIFSKSTKIPDFMKVTPVGAKLFYADWQRQDEADSRFSQFCEGVKKRLTIEPGSWVHEWRVGKCVHCAESVNL